VDGIIAERNVTDDGVEEVIRNLGVLEAFGQNGRIRIEALRNSGGDGIEFDARPSGAREKFLGHQAEEMSHSHRGLKNLRASPQAEALHDLPDGSDDDGRGVVCIGGRGAGGVVFRVGQKLAEFMGAYFPFFGRIGLEHIRQCAPAGIFCEQEFFCARRQAALGFDAPQRSDGFDIVESLLAQASRADPVRAFYPEVARGGWFWLRLRLADKGGGSSSVRNAHSFVANSQAA